MKPFRWNIAKREQLGSLVDDETVRNVRRGLLGDLRPVAARILAFADDADLAFIGRTPENFYDYLSGAFWRIDGAPVCHLIQFSLRWANKGGVRAMQPARLSAFFDYLTDAGLAPERIASAPRPIALIDFVAGGGTLQNFVEILKVQAERDSVDWNAVQRRLRIIGLRVRTHNSPNTWRWQQHQDWLHEIPDTIIKNVSAPAHLLYHIANDQPKVTTSFHPGRWGLPESQSPANISSEQKIALATAIQLFDVAGTRDERALLARDIAATAEMRQAATRKIVSLLKG